MKPLLMVHFLLLCLQDSVVENNMKEQGRMIRKQMKELMVLYIMYLRSNNK